MPKQPPSELGAAAEWCNIEQLLPWVKNPRKNDAASKKIAESIRRFGFGAPIVARRENKEIVAGHTRVKAVRLLIQQWRRGVNDRSRAKWHPETVRMVETGLVPVRLLDISEREAHLLALADNKLGELAEWDNEQLAEVLNQYGLGDAASAGYEAKELAKLYDALATEESEDADPALGSGLKFSVVVECENEDQQARKLTNR